MYIDSRVAVAQAALEFRRRLFSMTKEYVDCKQCWSPSTTSGQVPLGSIPQLRALYAEEERSGARLDAFVGRCESELTRVRAHCYFCNSCPVDLLHSSFELKLYE